MTRKDFVLIAETIKQLPSFDQPADSDVVRFPPHRGRIQALTHFIGIEQLSLIGRVPPDAGPISTTLATL